MNIADFIKYEDDDIVVLDKPSGLAVQSANGTEPSLLQLFNKPYYIVHRLDQRVSGLLVLAKNASITKLLSEAFQNGTIEKTYYAVVNEKPEFDEAILTHWLLHKGNESKAKVTDKPTKDGKRAILHYQCKLSSNKYHLLQINLKTGRFHQIRAQLAAIGSPIVGDVKYGYKRTTADGSIFLQSSFLKFKHPSTKQLMQFTLPLPILWEKYGITL